MLDHHDLRLAGRAGCRDEVGEVVVRRLVRRTGVDRIGNIRQPVHRQPCEITRKAVRDHAVGDDEDDAGGGVLAGQACRRILRVQGKVGRPDAQHGKLGDHQVRATGQTQTHERTGQDTVGAEDAGQRVRPTDQLGVADLAGPVADGRCVRCVPGPRPDRLVNERAAVGRVMALGIPVGQHPDAVGRAEHRQLEQRCRRPGNRISQQPQVALGHPGDGRAVEQIDAVLPEHGDPAVGVIGVGALPLRARDHHDVQIQLRRAIPVLEDRPGRSGKV